MSNSDETYQKLRQAIISRQQIVCEYKGYTRECCPHAIGTSQDEARVLVFQFGGGSSSGFSVTGEWRCMAINELRLVAIREGRWYTGLHHSRAQTCIKDVDIDITRT